MSLQLMTAFALVSISFGQYIKHSTWLADGNVRRFSGNIYIACGLIALTVVVIAA